MSSLLPKSTVQVRPRMAVEVRPEGVYAARADEAAGVLAQTASATLPDGAVVPSLRVGNIIDRIAVIAALKKTLGAVQLAKGRDVTLIVPDTAVRVLLLDFDELPSKKDEVLPVLRFRLAKLLPFPPDQAQVSWQVMSRHAMVLQVLVVAIPNEVLAEYESAVREAGFEPGAVLPSTLAVAAALDESAQTATLLVNASEFAATTAILRRGELLLHRTLELKTSAMAEAAAGVALEPANIAIDAELGDAFAAATVHTSTLTAAEETDRASLELLQAISVAAAYFEDSLNTAPTEVLTAGTLSARALGEMIIDSGMEARDVLQTSDLLTGTSLSYGLLAGLRGALKS
jgi:type IV pilus assembly protein PilM